MEYVKPVVDIANCLGTPFCKYLQYHRKFNDYVRNFRRIRDKLNSKMEDIELQLKAELLHVGKTPKKGVENWLAKVKAMIGEAQQVDSKVSHGRYLCRACNGKLVDEKSKEMQTFLDDAPNVSESLVIDCPSVGLALPTSELVGEKAVRDEIWTCLMQGKVNKIGVWGMGGVGKTTVMKHIHNELLKESKFDRVIWVTISKEFDAMKLQDDIASALNLKEDLPGGDKVRRAAILSEMLKKTGKHVLILDDVWDKCSLEDVGIPEPTSSNGCKLVLTSRSEQVCKYIGCTVILVRPLSEEEALVLFLNKVGPNIVQNPTLMSILRLVVNECAGLPLTIVVVAGTLKGEHDPRIWKNALKELKGRIGMVEGMEAEVIERLKFSFDHLKDEKVKLCFLYCALYPEDFEVLKCNLIECWIDEGLIDEMDTRQEMEHKGHAILKMLEDICLLENATNRYGWPCTKMHDALRDMALSITSTSPRYMIQSGLQLKKLPKEEEWKADIGKVSLMKNSISEIPMDMLPPNCQLLTTLLLQGNPIKKIPDNFFAGMPCLSVLNLSYTDIKRLPNSISELKNLTALLLGFCQQLRDLPCLSKLRRIKKLDLRRTEIIEVPKGMDMLVNLRYLNLDVHYIKGIPAGILPKLSHLQHLRFDLANARTSLKAEEAVPLEKLECFEGCFKDMHELNKFVSSMKQSKKNLIKYRLQVGSSNWEFDLERDKSVRINELKLCERELLMLPVDVQELDIADCHYSRSLNDGVSSLEDATDLRVCKISYCQRMECVISLSFSSSCSHPFESLERLYLHSLPNLSELIRVEKFGSTTSIMDPSATFSHLKVLKIWRCSNTKTLLPHWLLPNLQNLEEIWVQQCVQLIEIMSELKPEDAEGQGSDASIKFNLPNLRKIGLKSLPGLKNICSKSGVMVCDSLQLIDVYGCYKLKIPPFVPRIGNEQPYAYVPPSLKIRSRVAWWDSLEWDDPNYKNIIQHHFVDK
ncbi:hypothetical protein V6N12_063545 [Hibiscus sabdariffa]|uniref:AAA+ ATPase domain-containing protein n=1 Tax=Hibiscus sabdariffa TaxID=183260 RepID=A0ABR2FC43_9ROSI